MTREESFDTGTVKINYLAHGSASAEPLVMLHGGAWCWQEYLALIPSLSRRWCTYALDLRGNGASGWVPGAYRLEDFTGDVSEFVGRLELPAVLVGHSIGGVIALMVAARRPEKVKGVIAEDIALTLENYRKTVEASRDMYRLWLDLKKSARSEGELAVALSEAYGDYPGVSGMWILFFAGCLWRLDPTYFDALLGDFDGFARGYDYERVLAGIRCPVLFIRGEKKLGAVMTDGEITSLRRTFSNVEFAEIDGVGHLLHLEQQALAPVLRAMTTFLGRIPAPPAHHLGSHR